MALISPVYGAVLIGLIVVAAGAVVSSITVVAFGPLVALLGTVEVRRHRRGVTARRRTTDLINLVDDLILRLRSGSSLRLALVDGGQAGSGSTTSDRTAVERWMAGVTAALVGGHPLRRAVADLAADPRTATDDRLRLTAATLNALAERGGPAIPALQRLRFALAGLGQAADEAASQAGQARASAVLMAVAPLGFAVTLASLDPEARRLYLYSATGLACLMAAVVLSYAGWWWMAWVIDRSVSPSTRRGQRRSRDQGLGLVIELVSMVLAAGGTVRDAVRYVASVGPDPDRQTFAKALVRADHGELLADALPGISDELGSSYRSLVATLVLSEEGGAAIALTLSQLSDEADAARHRQLDLRVKRVSVTLLVPLLLCALPALIVGAIVPLIIVALGHLNG